MKIAAFFDFDKTLLSTESARIGVKYLWEQKRISLPFILKMLTIKFFYDRDLYSDEKMARLMLRIFKGVDPHEFVIGNVDQYYRERIKPHLAPNLVAKLEEHRNAGHVLVLLSAGVRHMLEPAAKDLGFHHLICTELEVGTDGLFTGRQAGRVCIGEGKRDLALELAQREGIDMAGSFAYGNHHSDTFILESVGHPTAVEPTATLRKTALERGWPILSFR
ncbi:MAG: HAD-IB family hydrolase [Smithellaceae bacterium]|nr:HAD-IB family hydrolase [Smithellaceae bacterium]